MAGWMFLYLWVVTIVWGLPLTLLVIGSGVARFMGRDASAVSGRTASRSFDAGR